MPKPKNEFTDQLKNILSDIRFWILIFFGLRLFGITNEPLEVGHNWRQALTNMIARNFLEIDSNILFPRIDMAGEKTGIIGSEFPFFNYLIFLYSSIFDHSHWIGRLINLTVSSFGIFYFYKLIKELVSNKVAFNSAIVLIVSIWFAFSRKIMPDTFSVSLVIIGLYYALRYLKNGAKVHLLFFFVFSTLGILCKIPALSLFSGLGIILFVDDIPRKRKLGVFSVGTLCVIIVSSWYFLWVPHLLETYRFQLYFPKGIKEGIHEIAPFLPQLAEKFYFSALKSYVAAAFALVGIGFLIKNKNYRILGGISIITAVFIVFIIKTGAVFPLHNYYVIPFVPVMALLAGIGISQFSSKLQYFLLALIMIEGVANQQHDFFIRDHQLYKLSLEQITAEIIPKQDLIIINGGLSPQDIYFSHRKGWSLNNQEAQNPAFIDSLSNVGAQYLIIDKTDFKETALAKDLLYSDEHYSIYEIGGQNRGIQ